MKADADADDDDDDDGGDDEDAADDDAQGIGRTVQHGAPPRRAPGPETAAGRRASDEARPGMTASQGSVHAFPRPRARSASAYSCNHIYVQLARAKRAYNGAKTRRTRRAPPIHWQRLGPAGALNRDDEARVKGAERERDRENDCLPQGAVLPKQWRRCHDSGSALPITRAGGRLVPCRRHGGIMRKRADQRGQEDSGPGIGSAHDNVHARAHPNAHVPGG